METPKRTLRRRARRAVDAALKMIRTTVNPPIPISPRPYFSRTSEQIPSSHAPFTRAPDTEDLPTVCDKLPNSEIQDILVNVCEDSTLNLTKRVALQNWAVDNSITHIALNQLLLLLQDWLPAEDFPKDARTLLKTPRHIKIVEKSGGQYFYFGIKQYILETLPYLTDFNQTLPNLLNIENLISLKVGFDGVPVSKSSNLQFWPILFKVDQDSRNLVHVACLYYGDKKPNNIQDIWFDFVEEMKVLERGFVVNDKTYIIRIRCIVADAPARSFLKSVNNHNAYYGCERCSRKGKWQRRVIYPVNRVGEMYSDSSFAERKYIKHHCGDSPIEQLSIGMISQIVLDYMHLCCLGVMKKLLLSWTEGPGHCKLRRKDINTISDRLISFRNQLPSEFSRKCRGLNELRHWKATEFRTFMLYTGPFALLEVIDKKRYEHFLLFHVSMLIFCTNISNDWVLYGKGLLEKFVSDIPRLYHSDFLSYNMHSLQHLYSDVQNHGVLDRISAFEFESHLYKLKKMLRTNKHHLKQVIHRVYENENISVTPVVGKYKEVPRAYVGSYYLTVCDNVCEVLKFKGEKLVVKMFKNNEALSHYPCQSTLLSIFRLGLVYKRKCVSKDILYKRCVGLNVKDKQYVVPLCTLF